MKARAVHFRVLARLDMASREQPGRVTITRANGVFSVRPARRRRTYDLPLDFVASMVCRHVIRAELVEKRREKAAARKARR